MLMPDCPCLLLRQPHRCLQKPGNRCDPILSQVIKYVQQGWPNHNSEEVFKPFLTRKDVFKMGVCYEAIDWWYPLEKEEE